jgi:hypothetical protein
MPDLADKTARRPLVDSTQPVVSWAEMWLEATGFGYQQAGGMRRAA